MFTTWPNPTNEESFPGPAVITLLMYCPISLTLVYGAGTTGGV